MARNKLKSLCFATAFLLVACGQESQKPTDMQSEHMTMNVEKTPMAHDGIVRLSKIQVHPEHLHEYMKYAIEVGETSLRTEPGVLTMYAMQDMTDSCNITILETYSSQEAYRKHIASDHFQKYKQGTLHMVKSLELCDQKPMNPHSKLSNIIGDEQMPHIPL